MNAVITVTYHVLIKNISKLKALLYSDCGQYFCHLLKIARQYYLYKLRTSFVDFFLTPLGQNFLRSFVVALVLWFFNIIIARSVGKREMPHLAKRRWIIYVRNGLTFVFIVLIFIIWSSQIQAVAISIVAFAAALVIGMKELLMCAMGGLLKASTHPFSMGDRIEIDDVRGDVIDTNLMTTKILEIGPKKKTHQYTGRLITIPNSVFLTKNIVNESFLDKYVLHVFQIPIKFNSDWEKSEKLLLEIANDVCKDIVEDARKNMKDLEMKRGLETPSVEPRVTVHIPDSDSIELIVRVPAKPNSKGVIEQKILKRYLKEMTGQFL